MGARIRSFPWSETPLGPAASWPQSLKTAVQIMLTSRQPIWLGWGPQLTKLYNDPYRAIVGGKHPAALGQPAAVVWREIWDAIGPMLTTAMGGDEGTYVEAQLLIMERNGYPEETYYTFSYSPILSDDGSVGGIICANTDDTQRVIGERQLSLLRELAAAAAHARTVEEACARSADGLSMNAHDLPFALIYLLEPGANAAVLSGASGNVTPGLTIAPHSVPLDAGGVWPCAEVLAADALRVVDLSGSAGEIPAGAWDRPPQQVAILPIAAQGSAGPIGVLVAGLNPYRLFDDHYRRFLDLVAAQISASIANAQAYEEERRRAEALAELDRAKTAFFANISHEFRTPLTLLLGPLEDLLQQSEASEAPAQHMSLDIAHRNALRLLKLVNTLLDFARIEAGRVAATYVPTDLAALTAELASVFRSTIEHAGVELVVDCPPLAEPVYVDREMWETIVLNLLSNAFKFTFVGTITVSLRQAGAAAELVVRDTGIGIPVAELPRLFERFHRVSGARGRTFEGSGIGLALVQELVKLHGGAVRVDSVEDQGTTFAVSLPLGHAHLPRDHIGEAPPARGAHMRSAAYTEEARRWLPDDLLAPPADGDDLAAVAAPGSPAAAHDASARPHILLADDNADIRAYIRRLLSAAYHVQAVSDGAAALRAARTRTPDLVLADVMMPGMDGFALLRELRADPRLRAVPMILLSARAGEEARVEGLEAGADDYLIKPFSARELLARVSARLELSRLRTQLDQDRAALANLFNQAPVPVAVLHGPDLVFELANPAYLKVIGRPDAVGKPLTNVLSEAEAHGFSDLLRGVMQTGQPVVGHEAPLRFAPQPGHETEDTYWTFIYAPLHNTSGQIDSVVAICNEVTEQVRARQKLEQLAADLTAELRARTQAEAALRENEVRLQVLYMQEQVARAQAEEANRLKDEFLATVSHELRTPLTAFLGYAQLLQRRPHDAAYASRTVERLVRSAKDQAQIIDDLLDVSRAVSGKLRIDPGLIDLTTTIRAALDTVRPTIDAKGIELLVELHPEASAVVGDANRLQQVMWNLLANAAKFTPPGGSITVRLARDGARARVSVSDTGKGISPAFLPYVFDRFRQADGTSQRTESGLGLGLAIVRHLVELHGGTAEAASDGEARGATFTVWLPLAAESAGNPGRPEGTAPVAAAEQYPPELAGLRVLVVDDQQDILELLEDILVPCGTSVRTALSARQALELAHTWRPDVIVTDIAMPEHDGYWLIEQVRALDPGDGGAVPAAALTAYVRVEERLRVLAAGFQQYVPKPVDPDELRAVVASLAR